MQLGHRIVLLGATAVVLVVAMGGITTVAALKGEAARSRMIADRTQMESSFEMAIAARDLRRALALGDEAAASAAAAALGGQLATYRALAATDAADVDDEELRLASELEVALASVHEAPIDSRAARTANAKLIERLASATAHEKAELEVAGENVRALIERVLRVSILVPALATLLVVGLSLGLLLPLRRRVKDLHAGAERMRKGDENAAIPEEGEDELARVAAAWNEMYRELRRTTVSRAELERNLAALQEAREQLVLADRLALVGTLAAGVAHEINNPLAYLCANLEWLRSRLLLEGRSEDHLRAIDEAADGAARIGAIVGDLRAFSREDETRVPVDLRQVAEDAIRLAGHEVRHLARLERQLDEVPLILGNRMRLGQVVLNLLVNAAQSFGEGREGTVTVRTRTDERGRAIVEVEDDGPGVPEEVRHRIFDPFFTTKPVGVGTGLGLSVCNGIVSAHGGHLAHEARPGGGSVFRVCLEPSFQAAAA